MQRMVIQRIIIGIITLWVVSVLVFVGTSVLPGDVAEIVLGQTATPETLAAYRAANGLDQPLYMQYVSWLGGMVTGDLGTSKAGGASISSLISGRLGNTMFLAGVVAIISVPLSVMLGLLAAMYPGTWIDRILTFGTLTLISVPDFFIATFMVLIFAVNLGWLPAIAHISPEDTMWETIRASAMPLITLIIVVAAQMIRMTRAGILNVMNSP
ncbi:MAG: ABC transporter permease, partial [Proteobacteria bacterium]|nr:ABC transporter permease [Pseudomonadota bacterium]